MNDMIVMRVALASAKGHIRETEPNVQQALQKYNDNNENDNDNDKDNGNGNDNCNCNGNYDGDGNGNCIGKTN